MINEQITETMNEVREVRDSYKDNSVEWGLMNEAHSALALAHSLVHMVNSIKLAQLLGVEHD